MTKIGVLALQGGFTEHIVALRRLGVEASPIRLPAELKGIDGLVIPGGESTTVSKLMRDYCLADDLNRLIAGGLPVLGTCAGMILLAKEVSGLDGQLLGAMDIKLRRNGFGRQVDSFEADLVIPALGQSPFRAVFIRAPVIERVGEGVEILACLPDGTVVAAREKNMVAAAFHPELTTDLRFHEYFLTLIGDKIEAKAA
ncbi:MAG: pyridoxal 5'-phosphate synthase glutaminase subunit PdxT [Dehalococcoidia bacterium]|nr:pyridoxal 5'-phosphate synthase glutaminase subunit PdxT [Dehalococcoidia bacterium]